MPIYNVTEDLVKTFFYEQYVPKRGLVCRCEKCQDDILAFALNRLPCRYVSSDQGNAFVKAQYMNAQLQSDIYRELTLAAAAIGERPRHPLPAVDRAGNADAAAGEQAAGEQVAAEQVVVPPIFATVSRADAQDGT